MKLKTSEQGAFAEELGMNRTQQAVYILDFEMNLEKSNLSNICIACIRCENSLEAKELLVCIL